MNESLICNDCT